MKVKTTYYKGTEWDDDADRLVQIDLTTGHLDQIVKSISIGEGEPEDMTLNRDLNDVYEIPAMLREAYEAGKRGEPFEEEFVDEKDD